MLIPRFSTRFILLVTTLAGFFFVVLAAAVQGQTLAIAFSAAVGSMILLFLIHVLVFAMALSLSQGRANIQSEPPEQSPFANESLPPQVLPPGGPRS